MLPSKRRAKQASALRSALMLIPAIYFGALLQFESIYGTAAWLSPPYFAGKTFAAVITNVSREDYAMYLHYF